MIQYVHGDIFESEAQTIVNPVNTVGVMGKGLALSFKEKYPEMFKKYREICMKGLFNPGQLMLFRYSDHWVLLFPTKIHWKNESKIEYIEEGLKKFTETYLQKGIRSVAFSKLGCGNGHLSWDIVKPIMEKYLESLPIPVFIYV